VAPSYVTSGGVCVLNQKCVRDHVINYDLARRHDASARRVNPERFLRVGDVLVNSTGDGTLGRVAQVRVPPAEPSTVDTHVTIVRPQERRFYGDFFGYMMVQIEAELAASGEGASGQTELARSAISERFTVKFPTSLPEQKRIVAILDEAFAGIDVAIANTEKNIENARDIAASSLSLMLADEPNARHVALEDAVISDCTLSYGIVQPGDEFADGLPIVRPTDLGDRLVTLDGLKRIDPRRAAGYGRTTLQAGDLLLCVRGTTGVLSQAAEGLAGANVTRGIVPIRFRPTTLKQDLGYFLLLSADVQKAIRAATYGAALMQINIRDVRKIKLRIPDLGRQDVLLAKMQEAVTNGAELADVYQRKLAALSGLKQSILQRAFAGELTAAPSRLLDTAAE